MTLLLDPDIRDWVVLPLFIIMVITGLLRQSIGILFMSGKVKVPYMYQRVLNKMKQCQRITRTYACHTIPTYRYNIRKQYIIQILQNEIDYCEKEQERIDNGDGSTSTTDAPAAANNDPMADMMANPMKMMGGNMFFMVQNMVMMQGIQHFFSGFILLKVPFPLTIGFKNMFQKGIMDMPDLQPSYVSSLSWYFLVMYGLRSFLKLMIGHPLLEQKENDMIAIEKLGYQHPPPQNKKQDTESLIKLLRTEIDHLELFMSNQQHSSNIDTVEQRLLGPNRYPKKKSVASTAANTTQDQQAHFLLGSKSSKKKQ